ncbi:MAG: hypothetical protein ACLRRN_08430 [Oscillospiraceae bacterium]
MLTGLWAYLHAVCLRQYQRGDMVPLTAMLITEPLLCALAWTLLQALRMVTRLRPRRRRALVYPLVWALFGLCLAILVVSVVLPAAGGVVLPRLYSARSTTAMLFFLLGALLWLTQPDTGRKTAQRQPAEARFCRFLPVSGKSARAPCNPWPRVVYCSRSKNYVRYARAIFIKTK